jgi:uncharacterized integral membrane protein
MPRLTLKDKIRLVGLGIVVLYFLLFLIFNMEPAGVDFILFTVRMPVAFLILFCGLSGAGILWGFMAILAYRRRGAVAKPADEKSADTKA